MPDTPGLDRRIRQAVRQRLLANLWGARGFILVAAALLLLLLWFAGRSEPLVFDGVVRGHVVGSFQGSTAKTGTPPLSVDVLLDNGERTSFYLPSGTLYRPDATVEMKQFHVSRPDGGLIYRFSGYVEPTVTNGASRVSSP